MIVVCGEALFDVFPQHRTQAGIELSARIGGSPFNLAVGLARLGVAPLFFGGLSNDVFGRRLQEALAADGVNLDAAPRRDDPSPLVLVNLDERGVPTYAFYGRGTAERTLQPADPARVPTDAQVIHVGSYCMVVEPVATVLRTLVERQRDRSLIVYDPNVRPTIEPRNEVWRDTLRWMLARTDILKVSDEDIHALDPAMSAEAFVDEALRAGVTLAVVTCGERGVLAAMPGRPLLRLPSRPVTVVDTVGAGDTFQAALLAWLSRAGRLTRTSLRLLTPEELTAALGFATLAAAITCMRRGADLPTLHDVQAADALV